MKSNVVLGDKEFCNGHGQVLTGERIRCSDRSQENFESNCKPAV